MKIKTLIKKLNTRQTPDKKTMVLTIRWLLVFSVFLWWWFTNGNSVGIALILVLSSTTLIRMQFSNSFWFVLLEEVVCFAMIPYWPRAGLAIILPSFEAGILGSVLYLAPGLLIIILQVSAVNSGIIIMLSLMAFSIGFILKAWNERENVYLKAADRERKQRYEMEQLKNEILSSNIEIAKLVETTERNRIAQQLHDSVGHEITGALFALQAYKKLEENKDERAKDILENALKRVESSSIKLRETVYQLRPETIGGSIRIQKLCEEFAFCPIKYRVIGDKDIVPAMVWIILEPCLKEALTNISKYSKAQAVEVIFDITPYIIRMNIKDNGIGAKEVNSGMGIFGIKERIRAAGGTVSIDSSNGFMLTCILPINI